MLKILMSARAIILLAVIAVVIVAGWWIFRPSRDGGGISTSAPAGHPTRSQPTVASAISQGNSTSSAASQAPVTAAQGLTSPSAPALLPSARSGGPATTTSPGVPVSSRVPQGEWATRVPAVSEYATAIPSAHVAALQEFQKKYPGVDPTETQDFYAAVLEERRTYGTELTDQTAAQYSEWIIRTEAMRGALVAARGGHVGVAITGTDENGRSFALGGFDGVRPAYTFTQNVDAAISTNANLVRMNASFDPFVGDTINGDGLYVSVTDLHTIFEHAEFQLPNNGGSRIILRQTGTDDYHATHCAGTIGAWGYDASIIGMAPRVWFRSLVYPYNTSGITSYGMRYPGESLDGTTTNPRNGKLQIRSAIGSTSLGATDSNTNRCVYTPTSATWDQTMWDYPYDIEFFAAGNDGGSSATLCTDEQTAKNITTIGNVNDVTRDTIGNFTGGGSIVNSSSRGPTFDGRIKPDLCGNGYMVKSTTLNGGNATYTGTSMATPNAAGTTALLIDYYGKCFPGHFLRSSSLRALLINTADDMGTAGPDYTYGWGVINVLKAAGIVKRYADFPATRVVVEDSVSSNGTFTANYTYEGSGPIRATLAWIDPAGTGQYAWNADHSAALVNNLNLRLISQGGTTYYPFVMPFVTGNGTTTAFDASLYLTPAKTGDNTTDNVEQVYIASPPAGNYTLQITVGNPGGTLSGGSQKFSLAVTGMAQAVPVAPAISSVSPAAGDGTNNFQLAVNGSGFLLGSDVILRRDGFPDVEAYGEEITGGQISCRVDTSALPKGRWDVVVRAPDGTEAVMPAAFFLPLRDTFYSNDFTGSTGLTLDSGWAVGKPNYTSGGPSAAFSGTNILAYNLSGNYPDNMAATMYAMTPAIDCSNSSKTQLSFRRWLGVESSNWDHATIEVSTNRTTWTTVWENPSSTLQDNAWMFDTYDISAVADGNPTVYVRWGMGPTDPSGNYCGWNIDDVQIQGNKSTLPPSFTSTPPTAATAGQPFSYSITTSDPDTASASLVLTASGLPSWMTFTNTGNGTGTLAGTPSALGNATIILSVTDGAYTTCQTVNLGIVPVGGNNAPVIVESTLPSANIGVPFTATIHATDADGQALALSNGARPAWLGFSDNGDGSATFSGTPINGTEGTFNITVATTDGLAKTRKTFVLTVINPSSPVVAVAATDAAAAEAGLDPGTFTLTRTGGNSTAALTVTYSLGGSATNGTDYNTLTGTATFAANSTTTTVTVTPKDDTEYEGAETVVLTLSEGTGYFVGSPSSATVMIADNDKPTVSVAAVAASTLEGATGGFTFSRNGTTALSPLTVSYTYNGTATAGSDYPLLSGNFTIPPGQASATLDVPAWQDSLTEPPETINLTIAVNAAYNVAASPGNAATMTIVDDTEQPILTITATDNEASELFSYKGNGNFTITRAGSTASAITVNLLVGGTATPDSDYTALPASVTIPAGQSTVVLPVVVLPDTEAEPDEGVTLTLQAGPGFTIGASSSATVNIYDDGPTQVRVELNDTKCSEGATADPGSFTLRRLGTRSTAITVNYTVSGTATNGIDYTTLNGTATIGANSGSSTIIVTPINDALVEGTETVILTVGAGNGYTVAEPSSATLEMRDDETVDVSVTVQDSTCKEQATPDTGAFRFTRSANSASPLIVNYTIAGSATNSVDYTTLNGTLTIPGNSTTADVIVTPINDALVEGTESVILTLAFNGTAYDLGDNRSQTLWIQDDESPSITLANTDNSAAEAEGGAMNPGLYTVTATSASASDLIIPYTVAGTATNGVDYAALSGNVTIPAGQTSATIPVDVVDDDIAEPAETVTVTLGQVAGYNLLTTGALTVNIAASDLPEANIVAADSSASENPVHAARFVVTLSKAPSANTTTIGYSLGGTATPGSDYAAPAVLTIPAGSNTGTITITPINDVISEGPETVTVTLAQSPNYTVGSNATATATIADDESDGTQTLVVSPAAVNVPESGNATFSVSLGSAPAADTAVTVAFQSGDTDLSVQSGVSLTFTPSNWNTPQLVSLAAAKDVDAVNGTATFLVTSPSRPSRTVTATEMDSEGPPTIAITSPSTGQIALPDLTDSLVLTAVATGAPATPSIAWSQVSGPVTAVFVNAGAASASVTFPVAGTYVLRATASGNSQTSSADLTVVAGGSAIAYAGTDVGAIGLGGSFSTGTSFTLTGEGPDITGTADKCYFLSVPMSGNFSVSARVVSQTNSGALAKAGLMVRQNTQTNAINAATLLTPASGVHFEYRNGTTSSTSDNSTAGPGVPYWVKITKSGNVVNGWSSQNGTTWTQVGGNVTLSMTDPILVGMAVSSYTSGNYSTAVFDSLSGMPAPNAAPQVNPGAAPAATTGTAAVLAGTASDDGLPSGSSLTTTWNKVSGPGTATFGNASAAATTVTFSAPGSYVLRISASDGSAGVFQDLAVTVTGSAYDAWIAGYPGAAGLPAAGDDPDHDGIPNLLEFALGGNPAQSDPNIMPSASTTGSGSATYLTLTFRRARADVTYTVQGSSDFSNWSSIPFTPVAVGELQTVSDTAASGSANPKRFLRLKVTMP